ARAVLRTPPGHAGVRRRGRVPGLPARPAEREGRCAMTGPYVNVSACAHGLSAGYVSLRRDEVHGALYIKLDGDSAMNIRIQLRRRAADDAARHAAELERGREGLRRLAAVAEQAAREIEQRRARAGGRAMSETTLGQATCEVFGDTPLGRYRLRAPPRAPSGRTPRPRRRGPRRLRAPHR